MLHIGYTELNLVSLVIAACVCLRGWLVIRMLCQRWFSLVQCVLILCVRWFRTCAVYMPGGAMSAVSCSGSLSDPWAPPPSPSPPLHILSMQADQDWCEGAWQWIHLSVVFVCVIETADLKSARNVTHDCKQYKLVAIKPIICIYICIEIVVLLSFCLHIYSRICICVFAETISHTVNKIASFASHKSFWGQGEPSFPRQLTIQLDLKFPTHCQHKENLSF